MKKSIIQNVVWKEGKYFVAQCLNEEACIIESRRGIKSIF